LKHTHIEVVGFCFLARYAYVSKASTRSLTHTPAQMFEHALTDDHRV
jgi:hypothetical protein